MKKKEKQKTSGEAFHAAAMESELFKNLMSLLEHCAYRKYEDGDPREPGWVTIKTIGAAWVVQVTDLDTRMFFQVVADTIDKAVETAETYLRCEEAPWEPATWLKPKKK